MSHPSLSSRLAVAALAALALAGTRAPARAEGGGETTREFADKNFKMTVPQGWEFSDPSEVDRAAGFVVVVKRTVSAGVEASAYALVRDAGSTGVDAMLAQVKENKSKSLQDVEAKIEPVAWSGAGDARVLKVLGKAENGSRIAWFVYAGVVEGRYHQLDVRSVNGAHHQIPKEIEAVVYGYRFLSGARAEEPPADGSGPGGQAPPGATKRFEKLGLSWTLPTMSPPKEGEDPKERREWGWTSEGNPDIAPMETGLVAVAALKKADDLAAVVVLLLPKVSVADIPPSGIVREEHNFEGISQAFEDTPVPSIDEDCKVGNARGAQRTFSGKGKDGRPLWIRFYFVTLKKQLYQVRVEAHDRAETSDKEWIRGVVDGLKWDDTTVGVRGPCVAPFRTTSEARSDWIDQGKKAAFKSSSVSLTKPPAFGRLKIDGSIDALKPWVFAAEAREKGAYLFVGIQRYDAKDFVGQKPPREPEALIDELEGAWKNDMGEPKTRPKSDKSNHSASSFRGAKGSQYEFTGTREGQPFVERGWVVKQGQNVYWIRAQFGGKDAEKVMGDDWNEIQKNLKLE